MNIDFYLINQNLSLIETMNKLDKIQTKTLFVTQNYKLLASITNGDIRRWILKKGDLKSSVKNIANYNPKYLNITEKTSAKYYINKYMIDAIPIVDHNKKIVDIIFKDNIINKLNIPVVIMAGGLGKRLEPYTKILPKPLIPIANIPITERIINNFIQFGVKDFYLILNHKKNMIKAYFNEIVLDKNYNINYIDEVDFLGTAGGLYLLKNKINQTFILSNCDILVLEDYSKIYNFHKKNKNIITIVSSIKNFKIPYGTIDIKPNGTIDKLKEKPELSFFINTGMYVISPLIIKEMQENKALDFTDLINDYKKRDKKIGIYPISQNSWLDMGELDKMEEMNTALNNYE